jgi:hypothetical protein
MAKVVSLQKVHGRRVFDRAFDTTFLIMRSKRVKIMQ